jgi:hypothetical protein
VNTEETALYTTPEIESAFAAYQATVADIAKSADWARFADMFTPTASL